MEMKRNRGLVAVVLLMAPFLVAAQAGGNPDWFVWVRQIAILVAAGAAGGSGVVWLTNRAKRLLGWRRKRALALAAVCSVLVAIAGMVAADGFSLYELRPENLSDIVIGIFVAAQAIYHTVKGGVS